MKTDVIFLLEKDEHFHVKKILIQINMKTYNKTSLPDQIIYQGKELKMNAFISGAMNASDTKPEIIQKNLRQTGRIGVLVLVQSKNLKGKLDLHGRPYQPTKHIFSN